LVKIFSTLFYSNFNLLYYLLIPLDNKRFAEALKAIADGKYTVEKLKDSFDLNDVQLNSLLLIPMI